MNLSISPIKMNNVSFGMAEFSKEGMRLAQASSDIYEPLKDYTHFKDPRFFKRVGLFEKAPLTKYLETKLPEKEPARDETVESVVKTMVECGATGNATSDAFFIQQLLKGGTQKHIKKLQKYQPNVYQEILDAEKIIFDSNWNNPMLSKGETQKLLDAIKDNVLEKEYVTLTGVIEQSDARTPKEIKQKPIK